MFTQWSVTIDVCWRVTKMSCFSLLAMLTPLYSKPPILYPFLTSCEKFGGIVRTYRSFLSQSKIRLTFKPSHPFPSTRSSSTTRSVRVSQPP